MQLDVIFVLAMIIALVGSVYFLKGIFTAKKNKERLLAFGKYAACVTVFLLCAWGFVFTNNLLWYGQNPENTQITLNLNDDAVEETSFLYLLQKLDATATPEDVVAAMGTDYEEHTQGNYMIRYVAPNCTLNGQQPMYISFTFNRKGTELLHITWSYKGPAPGLFAQTLAYLETNALGEAAASTANTADWTGLHLADTGEYLLLRRVF